MKIAKYPFAVLSAALLTVLLMTPVSSLTKLIWLTSVDMPVGIITSIEVILFDFQRMGIGLYLLVIIGFAIAFSASGLISKFSSLGGKYLYAIAGGTAIFMTLFLMVELVFQSELIAGNKTIIGKILHFGAGFFGGYFFYSLISSERSYTFIIRFLGIFLCLFFIGV